MLFPFVSTQSVRSSNQRSLLAHWDMLATDRRFPAITAFSPQAKDHNPEQLILWEVENAGDSGRRFRVRKLGLRAEEALGAGLIGKTMDEVVPASLREVSLEGAQECALSGNAIYTVITTIANGHQVDCERLLMPFGEAGAVEQIVASLQLISFQGPIDRSDVTRDFETKCYVSLSGRISSDWAMRNPTAAHPPVAQAPGLVPQMSDLEHARDETAASRDERSGADKRKAVRRKVRKTGRIHFGKTREVCTVRDMSQTGASIEVADPTMVPDKFTLILEMESASRQCAAVWRRDRLIGVRFG